MEDKIKELNRVIKALAQLTKSLIELGLEIGTLIMVVQLIMMSFS